MTTTKINDQEEQVRTALTEIRTCAQSMDAMTKYGDVQQGQILLAWERLTDLTGNHDLALNAGFEMPGELLQIPRCQEREKSPERDRLRQDLLEILQAADEITTCDQDSRPDTTGHIQRVRERILNAWESLAHRTGQHIMAIRHSRLQPVIPFDQIHEPYQALGVAAFHTGNATTQYRLSLADYNKSDGRERYNSAEQDASLAHRVLFVIHNETAQQHPTAPKIRKCAREMNNWLTQERAQAARTLGINPPPRETGNLQDHRIDGPKE